MDTNAAPDSILGQSDNFLAALERVSRVAPLNKPILIIGERGSGKELIAARLHYLSERWSRPYVKFNCAALNEELLESELFGHVAGAFTGAARARVGRFELANGGTIFLDELASMSQRLQEKLLRVIEYGEFERVGSSETLRVDVRLVGAANVDLPSLARAGKFREDLLDRLSFDVITVPPLRERRDDILLLAQKFAESMATEMGREYFAGFSPAAERALLSYDWPGNVRELRNVAERAVYRLDSARQVVDRIEFDPFASPYRPHAVQARVASEPVAGEASSRAETTVEVAKVPQLPLDFHQSVADYETGLLQQALEDGRFNQKRAAELLSLTYHQFRGLLRKYKLLAPER
ncbi:phage shock protein operon transcriptional activator [Sinimarinibacterium sp. CAU 1509]|uniref:phage shock protein operon transcriptional activator n=1 Tax=Sinimarinibacterium sp. CAU 1509 TaxID=2562283 RepID=UPI0010AD3273|nr:phage shock protein operon transcriptional activator [Sinimarinibacterium sp. CAU 1509]TJY60796.1 phage shock protein operon transcriptional activator [Sinimarinibacterium sp. CAU 1509]